MAKAHLFTRDQVKPAGQDDAPKAKTPEEIAAYNKKLADERKARKAAQQAAAAPAPAQPAAECASPAAPTRGGRSWVHKTAHTKRNTKQEAAHYDHIHAFPSV